MSAVTLVGNARSFPEMRTSRRYLSPALTCALDFLDMAWRLRFPKADRLVVPPSLESAASLERACSTREEFNERVMNLADVLGGLRVPHDLFDPELESDKVAQPKAARGRPEKMRS